MMEKDYASETIGNFRSLSHTLGKKNINLYIDRESLKNKLRKKIKEKNIFIERFLGEKKNQNEKDEFLENEKKNLEDFKEFNENQKIKEIMMGNIRFDICNIRNKIVNYYDQVIKNEN